MKKKIVSAVLALCMVLGSAASLPENAFVSSTDISASAYLEEYYGDYEFHTGYEKSSDGTYREIARLSLYLGNATNVVIPDNMVIEDNTSVTPIKYYAVTILEGDSFYNNDTIKSVTLPSTCKELWGSSNGADSGVFMNCSNLESVILNEGLEEIDINVFRNCPSLKEIRIPKTVKSIAGSAFAGDPDLNIIIDSDNPYLTMVDGVLYNKEKTELIYCLPHKTSVTIPNTVVTIDDRAFDHCSKLKSITLPDSVKTIGNNAFYYCKSLESVKLSSSLEKIGNSAFAYCSSLKNVSIPDSVSEIGYSAFNNCRYLESVKLPKKLKGIDGNTFFACTALKSITIPENVEFILSNAFSNCLKMTELKVSSNNKTFTSKDNTIYTKDMKSLVLYAQGIKGDFVVPDGVTEICERAFFSTQITGIKLPETLETIGEDAFAGCDFSSIDIPSSVKKIDRTAFSLCDNLEKVTLHEGLEYIGYNAFDQTKVKKLFVPKSVKTLDYCAIGYTYDYNEGLIRAKDFVMTCYPDTAAYKYAKDNKIKYELIYDKHNATHDVKYVEAKAATCTAEGNVEYYICKACKRWFYDALGTKEIKDHSKVVLSKNNNHSWGEAEYTWNKTASGYSCSAKHTCKRNSKHVETEVGTVSYKVTRKPTVNSTGVGTYTAVFKKSGFKTQTKNINLPKEKYNWGEPTYSWSKDYKTCTAKRVDKNNKLNVQTETATASVSKTPATCTANGSNVYTASFTKTAFSTQKKTVTVKALGHKYGTPSWSWNGTKSATAKFVCANNKSHVQTVKATVKSTTTKPTCTKAGKTVYTATAKLGGKTYTNSKTVTLKALGHKMGDWKTTSFNVDKKTATQTRKCARGDKTETQTVKNAIVRYAGSDRAQTASLISSGMYKTADTVIIATGFDFHDALAAVPLASAYNAPLLLADRDNLSDKTIAEIKRLKAKNVIVVVSTNAKDQNGNDAAIRNNVYKQLKELNVKVTKLDGKTYYATAKKVADQLKTKSKKAPTSVFITTDKNYADALSASPVAAILGAPILYVDPKASLNATTKNYLASVKKSVQNVYIVGGVNAVSKNVEKSVLSVLGKKSATRFAGDNRYDTCVKINKAFAKTLTGKSVCIAKGYNFPDALAGGVFVAKQKAPLFLADVIGGKAELSKTQSSYLKSKNPSKLYIFGGETAAPTQLVKTAAKACV